MAFMNLGANDRAHCVTQYSRHFQGTTELAFPPDQHIFHQEWGGNFRFSWMSNQERNLTNLGQDRLTSVQTSGAISK